ncbi:MAG: hypothetical protein M3O36_11345 [Myxococcota bacterium]|nr:hypothetical protein [Myxococcota bacterium]
MDGRDAPISRYEWNYRAVASALLEQWCEAPKAVRDEITALRDPAKLELLRGLVTTCNNLQGVEDYFGLDHHVDDGLDVTVPACMVGCPGHDEAIDVEFPAGGIVRCFQVEISAEAIASIEVPAASEEDARRRATEMLRNGEIKLSDLDLRVCAGLVSERLSDEEWAERVAAHGAEVLR